MLFRLMIGYLAVRDVHMQSHMHSYIDHVIVNLNLDINSTTLKVSTTQIIKASRVAIALASAC